MLALWVLQFVWLLFYEQDGNLLATFPDPGVADAVDKAQRSLAGIACVALAVVVALRWRAASRPRRRALLPSVAGSAALLFFAALLTNDLVTGSRSQVVLWAAVISLVERAGGVPRGSAALAAGPRRPGRPVRDLNTTRGATLQAALARTLGDPGLVVAYRLPESLGYADADGRPVLVPPVAADRAHRAGAERRQGDRDARLRRLARRRPRAGRRRVRSRGHRLENEHLHAESQTQLAEVQASRERLVAAGDAERRRLERNLHDGAQQRLVAIVAAAAPAAVPRRAGIPSANNSPRPRARARPVARGAARARPRDPPRDPQPRPRRRARVARPAFDGAGHGVLRTLTSRRPSRSSSPRTSSPPRPWPTSPSTRGDVVTMPSRDAGGVAVSRSRNGVGGADPAHGTGLRGLTDRVEALDGRLAVTSPPDEGTTVTAEFPCG